MAAASSLRLLALAGGLVLSACTDAPEDRAAAATPSPDTAASNGAGPVSTGPPSLVSPVSPAAPSDCNAPKAEPFVGRNADAAIRSDLTAAVAPITAIRWVGPGDATTEDYSPQRLNVMLDVAGSIVSVHCG